MNWMWHHLYLLAVLGAELGCSPQDRCLDQGGCWVKTESRCEQHDQSQCNPAQPKATEGHVEEPPALAARSGDIVTPVTKKPASKVQALGSETSDQAPAPSPDFELPPDGASWMKVIQARLGTGELVVISEGTRRAVANIDGEQYPLPPIEGDLIADPDLGLLWSYARQAKCNDTAGSCPYDLSVLDLTGNQLPRVALRGLSKKPYLVHLGPGTLGDEWAYDGGIGVDLTTSKTALKYDKGVYDGILDGEDQEAGDTSRNIDPRAHVQRPAVGLLAALSKRLKRTGRTKQCEARELTKRIASVPRSACEAADLCGEATTIPGSGLQLVIIRHDCGDACHVENCLYDPQAKAFLDPRRPQQRTSVADVKCVVGALEMSRSGNHWIHDDKLIAADGTPTPNGKTNTWLTGGCRIN